MRRTFHTLRRITSLFLVVVFIVLPFVDIAHESALRFDIGSLRLFFFGAVIPLSDFFIVLVACVFLTCFTLFTTIVFGRIWCGWLCPQTVLIDTATTLYKNKDGLFATIFRAVTRVAISVLVSGLFVAYFVKPTDIPAMIIQGGPPAHIIVGSWTTLTLLLYLDLALLGRTFCATACPYAKLQSVLFDERTLLITFNRDRASECMSCNACIKACPVDVDIKNGSQMACIHCAECVDACTERMSTKKRKSLIGYSFGESGSLVKGSRPIPIFIGILSLIFLLFLGVCRT